LGGEAPDHGKPLLVGYLRMEDAKRAGLIGAVAGFRSKPKTDIISGNTFRAARESPWVESA